MIKKMYKMYGVEPLITCDCARIKDSSDDCCNLEWKPDCPSTIIEFPEFTNGKAFDLLTLFEKSLSLGLGVGKFPDDRGLSLLIVADVICEIHDRITPEHRQQVKAILEREND